jgi:hypothetical protein
VPAIIGSKTRNKKKLRSHLLSAISLGRSLFRLKEPSRFKIEGPCSSRHKLVAITPGCTLQENPPLASRSASSCTSSILEGDKMGTREKQNIYREMKMEREKGEF